MFNNSARAVSLVFTGIFVVVALVFTPKASAAINKSFSYQGRLQNIVSGAGITSNDASCIISGDSNDTCDFRMRLYTAVSGGTLVWQETETNVEFNLDGFFSVDLDCAGSFDSCNQNGGPDFNSSSLYIELAFAPSGDSNFTEVFSPRRQLSSVPYSFNADTVDGISIATTTSTPEGSVVGSVGDLALDTTGGTIYIKTSGEDTNTGWTAVSGGGSGTFSKLSLTNAEASWDDITTVNRDFTFQSTYSGADPVGVVNFAAPADKNLHFVLYADGEGGSWTPYLDLIVDKTAGVGLGAAGYLNIQTSDAIGTAGDTSDYIRIQTTSNVPEILTVGAADLKINAGGSNNLLLNDGGGNIGIGNSSPGYLLQMEASGGGYYNETLNTWVDGSSIRYKENMVPITGALDIVNQLQGVYFNWNEEHGGASSLGFIAEDVGQILPQIVDWDKDNPQYATGLGYGKITAILTEAIKEQQVQIENLAEAVEVESVGSADETYEMLTVMGADLEGLEGQILQLAERTAALEVLGGDSLANSLNLSQFAQLVQEGEVLQFTGGIEFLAGVVFYAPVTFGADQVGTLTIPAGASKVKVTFSAPFASSPIVSLTPTQAVQGLYSLEEVTEEGFVVSLLMVSDIDLELNWTAFMVVPSADSGQAKVEVILQDTADDIYKEVLAEFDELANTETIVLQQLQILDDNELDYVQVRQEPTTASEQIGEVTPGETYSYDDSQDGWYYVEYEEGTYGWVSGIYVEEL